MVFVMDVDYSKAPPTNYVTLQVQALRFIQKIELFYTKSITEGKSSVRQLACSDESRCLYGSISVF